MVASWLIAAILAGAFIYLAVKLTITILKQFRTKKTSKLIAGTLKDIISKAQVKNVDDLPDEDDVVLAEYDEDKHELVQEINICKDVDEMIKTMLNNNRGIVVFD